MMSVVYAQFLVAAQPAHKTGAGCIWPLTCGVRVESGTQPAEQYHSTSVWGTPAASHAQSYSKQPHLHPQWSLPRWAMCHVHILAAKIVWESEIFIALIMKNNVLWDVILYSLLLVFLRNMLSPSLGRKTKLNVEKILLVWLGLRC